MVTGAPQTLPSTRYFSLQTIENTMEGARFAKGG
jgi:hypothetical protein